MQRLCRHMFSPLEEGERSSFWLIVELGKKLFAVSYSPLMIPINKLPLSDKNMKKSQGERGQGQRKIEGVEWGGPLLPRAQGATAEIQETGL